METTTVNARAARGMVRRWADDGLFNKRYRSTVNRLQCVAHLLRSARSPGGALQAAAQPEGGVPLIAVPLGGLWG